MHEIFPPEIIKSNYIDIIITEDNYDNVIGLAHYSPD